MQSHIFQDKLFQPISGQDPNEVHDSSPTLTAATVANRAAMSSRKPLQRQVRGDMQMVLICSISILVTGSHIT